MRTQRPTLKFLAWLVVAVILIYYFAQGLQWAEIKANYRDLHWGMAIASMVPIMMTYVVRSLRWGAFLEPIGQPSLRNLFAATTVGFSSIFVVGRVGEVARPLYLSLREPLRPSATLATIMIERLFDSTAVALLFALDLAAFQPRITDHQQLANVRQIGFGLLIALGALIAGLSYFRLHVDDVLRVVNRALGWLPAQLRQVLLNLLRHLADGLHVLHNARELLITAGYTLLLWALVTLSFWTLVRAFGVALSPASIVFILGFAMLGSLVPTPGGSAGAFHTATMVGLMALNIERNQAASMAIAMHLVGFGTALLFGVYFLIRDGISLKNLRAMIAHEMAPLNPTSGSATNSTPVQVIGAKP
ncbi:MAG: flippase-like domain-containing protein [Blastocatellia bacterium]|nr:flippase-like domain-containing protein [Blastocatellia bacterium]